MMERAFNRISAKGSAQSKGAGALGKMIRRGFVGSLGEPTPLQEEVWGIVGGGENVLVSSPTGSGKTLAAMMVPLDALARGCFDRSGVSVVYISPMKAMGQDLLANIADVCERIGPVPSGARKGRACKGGRCPISIGIRSGDVPQQERRRMLKSPPDVLIVTPENLLLMLCSSYRDILRGTRYVIIDEVHELVRSKRGMLLSLTLEYLNSMIVERMGSEPVRIGLSATVDERSAARFVAGISATGRARGIRIVKAQVKKDMVISLDPLVADEEDREASKEMLLDEVGSIMDSSEGALIVFQNTRARAEEMAYSLMIRGREDVAPHHGSLGGDLRRTAQEGLKNGELKCLVSSTSLELGIDIGRVALAVQISSPGDPVRLMQRIGRSGHALGAPSFGRIYPLDIADMLDSYAVLRATARPGFERRGAVKGPVDVLAQFIVGLSLEPGGASVDGALALSRRAHPFRSLRRSDIEGIVELLSARFSEEAPTRPRLHRSGDDLTPGRGTAQAFYLNCGTIPHETVYRVIDDSSNRSIGTLSRDFAESVYEGDVIMLGSRPLRIVRFSGSAIRVREDRSGAPTVPVWAGDSPPRPAVVAREIYDFWENGLDPPEKSRERPRRIRLERDSQTMLEQLRRHGTEEGWAPSRDGLPVEVIPAGARLIHIFHLPEGRRVNDLLSRLLVHLLRRRIGARLDMIAAEDGFAISSPVHLGNMDIPDMLGSCDTASLFREIALGSSFYLSRFSHCASRALLILSRFGGRETGIRYRRGALDRLLKALEDMKGRPLPAKGPLKGLSILREEALNETFIERMDIDRVREIAGSLSSRSRSMTFLDRPEGPGALGKNIIRQWWREVTDERAKKIPELMQPLQRMEGDRSISLPHGGDPRILSSVMGLLRGEDTGMDADRAAALAVSETGISAVEELLGQGRLLAIDTVRGTRYIDVSGFTEISKGPLRKFGVALNEMLVEGCGMRALLKRLPFISDPLDIILRTDGVKLDDIRSSIMGGRLIPVRVLGRRMLSGPDWARTFNALYYAGEGVGIGSIRSRNGHMAKGDGPITIPEFQDMAPTGIDPPEKAYEGPGFGTFEIGRRFMELLDRLGPLPLSLLTRLLNWRGGSIPPGVLYMIDRGYVELYLGHSTPEMRRASPLDVWFRTGTERGVDPSESGRKKTHGNEHRTIEQGWVTIGDPYLAFIGNARPRHTDPRVKGARGQTLVFLSEGAVAGRAVISISGDLVRVHDIDVDDHARLEGASRSLLRSLERLEALGYDSLTLDSVGGAPSGEGDNPATRAFVEGGFRRSDSANRSFLSRGPMFRPDMKREKVILAMLMHQGLLPGHHPNHPLEVIDALGGVIDRWEVLSRIGRNRHTEKEMAVNGSTEKHALRRFDSILESLLSGRPVQVPQRTKPSSRTWGVELAEMRDLKRRHDLHTGMLDQNNPVISFRGIFERFPPNIDQGLTGDRMGRLLSSVERARTMRHSHPDMDDDPSGMRALLRSGMIVMDPWGSYSRINRGGIGAVPEAKGRPMTRGVLLRGWILHIARSLGMFTFRDLLNCSPRLGAPGRVRIMLKELCREHLDRNLIADPVPEVAYSLKDLDLDGIERVLDPGAGEALSVISSTDRMAKVLNPILPRGRSVPRGHLFLSGASLVSSVRFRSAPSSEPGAMKRLVISSMRSDPSVSRRSALRMVKRAMYSMGYDVGTREEIAEIVLGDDGVHG